MIGTTMNEVRRLAIKPLDTTVVYARFWIEQGLTSHSTHFRSFRYAR